MARAEGKRIRAIGTIIQRNPNAIISLSDSGINRPQDLVGKRIAVTNGGTAWGYNALITSQGLDPSQIEAILRTTYGIDPLINGEVDALTGWIINEGDLVKQAGYQPNFIIFDDYGIETYSTVIFTTDDMTEKQPDVVQRFLFAMADGMQDTISNPNQAIEVTVGYNDALDLEEQRRRLQILLPLLNPANSKPMMMHPETWAFAYQTLLDQDVLSDPIDIKTVYTMDFLEKLYNP